MDDVSFPLHEACKSGKLVIVRRYIQNGYNVNEKDSLGWTPLMWAVSEGHLKIVKELVRAGADVDLRNLNGRTALHLACYYDYQKVMKLLIESMSNINEQDKNGKTALMLAAEQGHCSVVGALMKAGADTTVKDDKGETAVCLAESYAVVRHLVTDVEELSTEERNHVLWHTCDGGDLSMVKSVIRAGCDLDHFHRGHTPLMMASIRGHDDVVKELILAGCKVDLRSEWCFVGWFQFISKMVRAWPALVVWAVLTLLVLMVPNVWVQIVCYWILTIAVAYFNEPFKILRMKTGPRVAASVGIVLTAVLIWEKGRSSPTAGAMAGIVVCDWTRTGKKTWAATLIKVVAVTMTLALIVAGVGEVTLAVAVVVAVAGAVAVTREEAWAVAVARAVAEEVWALAAAVAAVVAEVVAAVGLVGTIVAVVAGTIPLAVVAVIGMWVGIEPMDSEVSGTGTWSIVVAVLAVALIVTEKDRRSVPTAVVLIATVAISFTAVMGLIKPLVFMSTLGANHLFMLMLQEHTLSDTGMTALHYAAWYDHITCGTHLVEGGANVRAGNRYFRTPLHICSHKFRNVVQQVSASSPKRVIAVIGNSKCGKSTLIAALQSRSRTGCQAMANAWTRIPDITQRTTGIETIPFSGAMYGEVLFCDFAGQSDYHGPHQPFLEAMLNVPGLPPILLLLVKMTEGQEIITQQLFNWLQPVALASVSSTPKVIVVGSFLDQVKSKKVAKQKLKRCIDLVQKEYPSLKVERIIFLDCREPESDGIFEIGWNLIKIQSIWNLWFMRHGSASLSISYNINWVMTQLQKAYFCKQSLQLTTFRVWLQDNAQNLPTNLPPPEDVCYDLSAAGCILFLRNKQDLSQSWLILDLQTILHDVYGTLFSPDQVNVNQFGLLHCTHLSELFPKLDPKMIQEVLITLEFCIRVDPLLLKEEVLSLTEQDEVEGWLYFPALVSAKALEVFTPDPQCLHWACWQLKTDDKHIILAHLLQGIILGIAATHVFIEKDLPPSVRKHCCSVWRNGISWRSTTGVNVAVQINDSSVVQVIGRSREGPDELYRYMSNVTQCIFKTIAKLSPALKATPYIIRPYKHIDLDEAEPSSPATRYPVASIVRSIEAGHKYVHSLPIESDSGSVNYSTVSLLELFRGWSPSLHVAQCLKERRKRKWSYTYSYCSM